MMKQRTSQFTVTFVGILCGLAMARHADIPTPLVTCAGFVLLFLLTKTRFVIFAALFFGIGLGLWRGQVYMQRGAQYKKLFHKRVVFTARADNDAIYVDHGQLSFDVTQVTLYGPYKAALVGKIKVSGLGASMVYRGDKLQVSGSLSETRGSAQAKTTYAKITVLSRAKSPIDVVRRRFITGLLSTLPEPEASFGAGLLLGQRSTIPKETNDQLSATGLTHLVAVSGYNLTIIIMAVRRLLGRASKFQSTMTAGLLMFIFVLITGLSASIVRAALVSGLSLLTWYYGRQFKPWLLISLSAALTAMWNPFYLWSDIGWYLSFLAFFGVLIIAPVTLNIISTSGKPKMIGGLLAETTAAQIMTLPIIMYIFGRLSVIGLLANLLVVPIVPFGMLLSLFAGLSGMISPTNGGWIALPAKLLLTYMIDITGVLSRLPNASVEKLISLPEMISGYIIILLLTWLLWIKKSRNKDNNMLE